MSRTVLDIARNLVKIDTHAGGETKAAKYLQEFFVSKGISATISECELGRGNLVASLPGGPGAGLLLHSHLDTADFGEIKRWSYHPLSGKIEGGRLHGRGTLDCKGLTAVHAEVMARIRELNLPLLRPLVMLASADEETGGALGSQYVIAKNADVARCRFVLGEGGGYPLTDKPPFKYTVQTEEFGRFVFPMRKDQTQPQNCLLKSPALGVFQALLEGTYHFDFYSHLLKQTLGIVPTRLDWRQMFTSELTQQNGMIIVDTPFKTHCLLLACFGQITKRGHWTISPPKQVRHKNLINVLSNTLAARGSSFVRHISPGHSDNRYFRNAGMETLGFFPLTPGERVAGIHGYDESISIASLDFAADLLFGIVCNFVTNKFE